MIYVGIDVAKDKHDCIIVDSDGVIRFPTFTIPNNKQGFRELLTNLKTCGSDFAQIKVGLEATGHYSDNLLEFLIANDLPTTVINPLHTNLYRKGLSLRKTKTDTVDAHSIVTMLRTECLKPYSKTSYHVRELKSLTRYRFDGVKLLWSFCLTTLPMLCNQTPLPTIRPDQDLCCSIDRRIVLFFFEYTPVPTTMNCIL